MTPGKKWLLLTASVAFLTACAHSDVDGRIAVMERQIDELDQRLESLEALQSSEPRAVEAPCIDPAALRSQIKALWLRRDTLSLNYTDAHPSIRIVDKRIQRLEQRLQDSADADAGCEDSNPTQRD